MPNEVKRGQKQRDRNTQRETNQDELRINLRTILGTRFTEIGKISGEASLRKKIMIYFRLGPDEFDVRHLGRTVLSTAKLISLELKEEAINSQQSARALMIGSLGANGYLNEESVVKKCVAKGGEESTSKKKKMYSTMKERLLRQCTFHFSQ